MFDLQKEVERDLDDLRNIRRKVYTKELPITAAPVRINELVAKYKKSEHYTRAMLGVLCTYHLEIHSDGI
jgi:hypothetical protein